MPLSDDEWAALARGLRRAASRAAPGWTDLDGHDPGVTVLQLLAYALDELSYRSDRVSDDARAIARRVAERATVLAGGAGAPDTACSADDGALVRPRFFAGQLLSADDLAAEQDYVRDRIDRRNRMLCGAGIVDGLGVTVDGDGGPHVVVAPGLAFDRFGREIFVGCPQRVALPAAGTALVVCVAYRERALRFVSRAPGIEDSGATDASQATRVVETLAITLAATPGDDALAIAQVRLLRGRWRVDSGFRPARGRR